MRSEVEVDRLSGDLSAADGAVYYAVVGSCYFACGLNSVLFNCVSRCMRSEVEVDRLSGEFFAADLAVCNEVVRTCYFACGLNSVLFNRIVCYVLAFSCFNCKSCGDLGGNVIFDERAACSDLAVNIVVNYKVVICEEAETIFAFSIGSGEREVHNNAVAEYFSLIFSINVNNFDSLACRIKINTRPSEEVVEVAFLRGFCY